MQELVIISGKGGTGKTSLTAAFATLASHAVLVDCDVDAADLHLVLSPAIQETHDFSGGKEAQIIADRCTACGECLDRCRFDAIHLTASGAASIDPIACEGCGVCAHFCPASAIAFEECWNGQWFRSHTRVGPLIHARLGIAAENSGKLVALIRREARALAQSSGAELILVDGPPGIGCPVIASLAGADHVVIVTEPTVSGAHDLARVITLTRQFSIPSSVVINKADLYPAMTEQIERDARAASVNVLGRLAYDPVITRAQLAGQSVVEFSDGPMADAISVIWQRLLPHITKE